ncbi:hypothetical protein [Streptomyces sp. NRRL S-350]|uniref:hypothetical protein n=1 Tax=Streptomyces sp. NRRL S-350 TaxID=1463902 RepID=UPI0004C268D0|nr:hypothetical protein [Streptomyces sp. NRRL S-350]
MTPQPPKTPAVALARVLRSLGLTQGKGGDFRVTGEYRNGERIGTFALLLTRRADEVATEHADEIEKLANEDGFSFRVSVRYIDGKPRPFATIANYGSRIRDTPPAAEAEPVTASTAEVPAAAEPEAQPDPDAGLTAMAIAERRQAYALDWSIGQAALMDAAGSVRLLYDRDEQGALRHCPVPGEIGRVVEDERVAPLVDAGFLAITEPYGPGSKRISTTEDGRHALQLWRRWRPDPAIKERTELQPLIGGQEEDRRKAAVIQEARERMERRQAEALNWTSTQADLMLTAAGGQLRIDPGDVLRHMSAPGRPGRRLDLRRLLPLTRAGFLTTAPADAAGCRPVALTADGRRAVEVWKRWEANKEPRRPWYEELMPLVPLFGGQEALCRDRERREEDAARDATSQAFHDALDQLLTWEERQARMRAAWAKVEGIRNPVAPRPAGWAPTDDEAARHGLAPTVVRELREEAANPEPRPALPNPRTPARPERAPLPAVPSGSEQLGLFDLIAA